MRFVYFVNDQKGFIGGNNSFFLKTVDGGSTWSSINIPGYGNFLKMQLI